jgi:hypothetical protein
MITLALLALLLAACSNVPGDTDITSQVRANLLADGMNEIYDVIRVDKTNGRTVNDNTYEAQISYALKFKVSYAEIARDAQKSMTDLGDSFEAMMVLTALEEMFGNFKQGEIKEFADSVLFAKTENGWQISEEL